MTHCAVSRHWLICCHWYQWRREDLRRSSFLTSTPCKYDSTSPTRSSHGQSCIAVKCLALVHFQLQHISTAGHWILGGDYSAASWATSISLLRGCTGVGRTIAVDCIWILFSFSVEFSVISVNAEQCQGQNLSMPQMLNLKPQTFCKVTCSLVLWCVTIWVLTSIWDSVFLLPHSVRECDFALSIKHKEGHLTGKFI